MNPVSLSAALWFPTGKHVLYTIIPGMFNWKKTWRWFARVVFSLYSKTAFVREADIVAFCVFHSHWWWSFCCSNPSSTPGGKYSWSTFLVTVVWLYYSSLRLSLSVVKVIVCSSGTLTTSQQLRSQSWHPPLYLTHPWASLSTIQCPSFHFARCLFFFSPSCFHFVHMCDCFCSHFFFLFSLFELICQHDLSSLSVSSLLLLHAHLVCRSLQSVCVCGKQNINVSRTGVPFSAVFQLTLYYS